MKLSTIHLVGFPRCCPSKEKSIEHTRESFEKLGVQGRNRVAGHTLKMLFKAFNFGGAGVDTKLKAFVISPVHMETIKLELSGMGPDCMEFK
jgi:hypothetical protein